MPTHKWEGTWAIHCLTGLGRSLCNCFGVRCGSFLVFRVKDVFSSLGSIWGSVPNYGCAPIRLRVPRLPIVLPGWGDPCANFLGSGAVVIWAFGVRCGRVKLVSSSLGSIWGVSAELRMPTYKGVPRLPIVIPGLWGLWVRCGRLKLVFSSLGSIWGSVPNYGCPPISERVPGLPIVLPGWGDPCANFLRSGAVFFWDFWVRCGRVKLLFQPWLYMGGQYRITDAHPLGGGYLGYP